MGQSNTQSETVVQTFFELLNAEDLEGVRALLTEDAAWLPQARDMPGAGEYRGRAPELGAARNLFVGVPVADHEPAEAHPSLQNICQQIMVGVQLHAIPTVIGSHDDQDAGFDRRRVPRAMHRAELRFQRGSVTEPSASKA